MNPPGRARDQAPDDLGSATVLVVALACVAIVLASALAGLGAAVAARHRAEAAADLAALAGAQALQSGEPACPVAEEIAAANGAVEVTCTIEGREVVVGVAVETGGLLSLPARTISRAGPSR